MTLMRTLSHYAERLNIEWYIREKQSEMQVTPTGHSLLASSSISS